jgi:hypothetical protein
MKAITLKHDLLRVGVIIPPLTVPRLATDFLPDLTDLHARSPLAGPKLPRQRRLPQDDMFHLQQEEQLSSSKKYPQFWHISNGEIKFCFENVTALNPKSVIRMF